MARISKNAKWELRWQGKGDRRILVAWAIEPGEEEAEALARGAKLYWDLREADAAIDAAMAQLKKESAKFCVPGAQDLTGSSSPGPKSPSYGRAADRDGRRFSRD